ncbi:MAG: glycosyltransferase [Alicyclobacillus sp.]|nr:glycosyltransferase [Alicyclobacillus sp.]
MKIWLITTEYPPLFGGGIATYCQHTASMFARFGHDVTVFTSDPSLDTVKSVATEALVRVIRFKPGMSDVSKYLGYVAALSYEFSEVVEEQIRAEGPPDIIECQEYLGVGYFLLLKKKTLSPALKEVPILITLHTPKFLCDMFDQHSVYKFPDFWIGEMERFSIRAADVLVSPSKYLVNELNKHVDLSGKEVHIIPNPYLVTTQDNTYNFSNKHRQTELGFLYVGRLEYRKGVYQMLRYLQSLWDDGLDVPLTMIGGDTYFAPRGTYLGEYLQKKFQRYFDRGLIRFLGKVTPHKVVQQLQEAKVILVPSLFENYPYTVVESMAHGKIVLASTSGGQSELIEDRVSGVLFSHAKPDTFGDGLRYILDLSPANERGLVQAARTRAQHVCGYDHVYRNKISIIEMRASKHESSKVFPFIRARSRKPEFQESVETDKSTKASSGETSVHSGLLSVVIPFYNMGDYIHETVDCISRVTYENVETIIVDDGSDDPNSIAALHDVENRYPVRIIHMTNKGLATARNVGAKHARGEYIAFLDADDLVDSTYYEKAIRLMEYYENVSFVGCWTEYFSGERAVWPTWIPEPPYLLVHNPITSGAVVLKRAHFLLAGLNDPDLEYGMEDYEFTIRMISNGFGGVIIPEPLFKYRVRKDSMSRHFNISNQLYTYQLISNKHSGFLSEYAVDVYNLLMANGPGYLYDNPTWEYPSLGFRSVEGETNYVGVSGSQIPSDVRDRLLAMWRNKRFRRAVELFFKLGLDKFF